MTISGGGPRRPDAPLGGYKLSGFGSERGEEGFCEFLQVKHVQVKGT